MNYNSMEELLNAGITNSKIIFDSNADDSTYTVAIPDWVKFNGVASSVLYYSSNSWLGLVNAEQIVYHRRDTRMYRACLEEGTIYDEIRFIRYYFKGTSHYSNEIIYEWEIFFFDTGDIMVHAITVPDIEGSYYVQGAQRYDYTAPTLENPYVTFYSLDENNSTFSVEYAIIELHKLQYLVEDENNVIYTVENDALVSINTTTLSAEVFKEHGCNYADITKVLIQIPNVKVYSWCEHSSHHNSHRNIKVTAVPFNQIIYSDNLVRPQLGTYVTVLGIENVTMEYEGDPLIAVSFDGGTTWNAFKNNQWVNLEQDNSGNTPAEIVSISTPEWNTKFDETRQIRFRFTLTEGDSITNLIIHYINPVE